MALQDFAVEQLAEDLSLQDEAIAYVESSFGVRKHSRYMQNLAKVRVGMQNSPEYKFYDNGAFNGMQWDFLTDKYAITFLGSRISSPANPAGVVVGSSGSDSTLRSRSAAQPPPTMLTPPSSGEPSRPRA